MKQIILFILLVISFFATSCENKWPKNGYLDGMWQVMTIKHNGEFVYTYDENNPPRNEEIHYISFQLKMFELTDRGSHNVFYGRFERKADSIRLYQISYYSKNESSGDDNILIPDSVISSTVEPWGLYRNDNTYSIVTLTENKFIIQNDSVCIELRKF